MMTRPEVRELGDGRLMIDLGFRDAEGLVSAYLFPGEDGWSLVETGPTTCLPRMLEGLSTAGISPSEVARVFVTHIHLDHAGGLGSTAAALPSAQLFAHERGVPHLLDPTRLAASARRAWGPASDAIWGAIEPVPPTRLTGLKGGERFAIAGGDLEVLATPGHAQHHLSFVDRRTRSLLTGDSAGVKLEGSRHARPALPPPDLDLDQLFQSLEAMAAADPRRILYSHFGPSEAAVVELGAYRESVTAWRDAALAAARDDASVPNLVRALRAVEQDRRDTEGSSPESNELISGFDLAAQGLLRYFATHGMLSG